MTRIVRVGATFPPDLLKEFDEIVGRMGYNSRSKAIQDSVRLFVTEYKGLREQRGTRIGVLVIVYDHEVEGLEEALTNAQHKYGSVISSSMHVHLSDRDCLEAIAVKGDAEQIRKLGQELATMRGIKQVKTTLVSI